MKKLLTQPPTSQNRSKAVHYLTKHPDTPHTADLRSFASSHMHIPRYVSPHAVHSPTLLQSSSLLHSGSTNNLPKASCNASVGIWS